MIRRRLLLAVAVGLTGLGVPAGASAAAGWPYVVSGASGSAVWHYNGLGGGGTDAVNFRAHVRRALGVLRVRASYADQNARGCGSLRRIRTRNYQMPTFSVQGSYVVVTWRFPLPKKSYCDGVGAASVAQLIPAGAFSQKVPLSRFNCPSVSLRLVGDASLPQGATPGTLTYHATLTLTRRMAMTLNL